MGFHCFAAGCGDPSIGDVIRKLNETHDPYPGVIWEREPIGETLDAFGAAEAEESRGGPVRDLPRAGIEFPHPAGRRSGGTTLDGPMVEELWSRHGDAVKAVSFGNGLVGLFYQSDGLGYMAIPNGKSNRG